MKYHLRFKSWWLFLPVYLIVRGRDYGLNPTNKCCFYLLSVDRGFNGFKLGFYYLHTNGCQPRDGYSV